MADKYLALDPTTGFPKQVEVTVESVGAGSAGDAVGLDTSGRLHPSLMPAGIGAATVMAVTSEALAAGDVVNFHSVAGERRVRKANATDVTKPAHGFVLSAVSIGVSAEVYTDGQNVAGALGSFVAADIGKTIFLSTSAGLVTLTPPTANGNIVQPLGEIYDVGSAVSFDFRAGSITIM